MLIITKPEEINKKGVAATIGFFDGVHKGHRFLIDQLKQVAKERNLSPAVITFPAHPRTILHSDYQPRLLSTFNEKLELLNTTHIDYCILQEFTIEISHMPAKKFIMEVLVNKWNVKTLLMGYDHRFGHDRIEDLTTYIKYGKEAGIEVLRALPFNEGEVIASSSEIRKLLERGEIEKANQLLGYSYCLHGTITSGHQIGRTIGFPTANIQLKDPNKLIPKTGVYAVGVSLQGKKYKGMLYIGNRPTLQNGSNISLEVHILNFSGDIYNNEISITFISYLRDDIKFASLDALKEQLVKDKETITNLIIDQN